MSVQHEVHPVAAPAERAQPIPAPVAHPQQPEPAEAERRAVPERATPAAGGAATRAEGRVSSAAPVVVRRRASLHAVVALCAAGLSVAYVTRAMSVGGAALWGVAAALAAVALWHLWFLADARSPLLVADSTGVRVRTRRGWHGLRWSDIDSTAVAPRRGLRDGAVTICPGDDDARSQPGILRVPMGLGTVAPAELGSSLHRLANTEFPTEQTATTAPEATQEDVPQPADLTLRPAARAEVTNAPTARATLAGAVAPRTEHRADDLHVSPAQVAGLHRSGPGNVSVLVKASDPAEQAAPPGGEADAQPASVPGSTGAAVAAPVIGPQIRQARERLGVSVDDLANRTRIRTHVIEALEVDDFEPCGGDFYARGHIRALSRVVGIDAEPLVHSYDARYAAGPISPRTVFQADFAAGSSGALRRGVGGPHWGALVATVLVLTLVWGVARIVFGA